MICPQCKAEYRRGFTVCGDCDEPLVESTELAGRNAADDEPEGERIRGTPGDPNTDPFCSFWKGTDLRVCTEICTVLDEAEIPHKMIRRQDHLFNWSHQSPYQIGVPASLYEKAELAIKEAFGTDRESGDDAVRLLPPPEEDPQAGELRSVWIGGGEVECADLCRELQGAGIYYRVDEQRESGVSGRENRYEIGVPEGDYERAKAITGGTESEFEDEAEEQELVGIPDAGNGGASRDDSLRAKREGGWYREDATSLAWEGEPADSRHMIEMSLKENDIQMRWETQDGKSKLFVVPEDEQRAKEIVREVVEGQPPG